MSSISQIAYWLMLIAGVFFAVTIGGLSLIIEDIFLRRASRRFLSYAQDLDRWRIEIAEMPTKLGFFNLEDKSLRKIIEIQKNCILESVQPTNVSCLPKAAQDRWSLGYISRMNKEFGRRYFYKQFEPGTQFYQDLRAYNTFYRAFGDRSVDLFAKYLAIEEDSRWGYRVGHFWQGNCRASWDILNWQRTLDSTAGEKCLLLPAGWADHCRGIG